MQANKKHCEDFEVQQASDLKSGLIMKFLCSIIIIKLLCSLVSPSSEWSNDPSLPAIEIVLSGSDDYWKWLCKRESNLFRLFHPFLADASYNPTFLFVYYCKVMDKCEGIPKRIEPKAFSRTLYLITWRLIESADFPRNEIKQKWVTWSINKHIASNLTRYADNLTWSLDKRNMKWEDYTITHKTPPILASLLMSPQNISRGILKTFESRPSEQREHTGNRIVRWLDDVDTKETDC